MSAIDRIVARAGDASPVLARVCAFALGGTREPPREMQLWNRGENPTDYGVHLWTDRSVREVGGVYAERGNPLPIDVEHASARGDDGKPMVVLEDGKPPVTGGYAQLEIRAGAPWLVFDWSDYAASQIRSGERRFLSPEYDVDRNTKEIVGLQRVSLVADPGTHHARMLATANRKVTNMDPILLAALTAALSNEDPAAAIASVNALLSAVAKATGGDGPADESTSGEPSAPVNASEGGAPPPADDKDKKPEPVAAAADDKDKTPVACAAPEAVAASAAKPAPVVAPAAVAPPASQVVHVAASSEVTDRLDRIERDALIAANPDAFPAGPVRVWASSQRHAVVKSFVDARPATLAAPARPNVPRGDGQGGTLHHLTGADRRVFEERCGISADEEKVGPSRNKDGNLEFHAGDAVQYAAKHPEAVKAMRGGK